MMEKDDTFDKLRITGLKVNYLHVCKRKLWFFDKGIGLENTSDKVLLGALLQDYSYPKEKKRDVLIDDLIQIDLLGADTVREIKYSDKLKEADRAQILYYLYYLKKNGIHKIGVINYPKMKKREEIILTEELEKEVENDLIKVREVLNLDRPPKADRKPYCSKCAYYEFCWS